MWSYLLATCFFHVCTFVECVNVCVLVQGHVWRCVWSPEVDTGQPPLSFSTLRIWTGSIIGSGMNGWLDVLASKLWAYIWLLPHRAGVLGELFHAQLFCGVWVPELRSSFSHWTRFNVLYSFSYSEDFLFLICVNIWLPGYRSIICMPGTWGVQKRVLYSLELELQIAVSHHGSFANWTQFLYKSSKRS